MKKGIIFIMIAVALFYGLTYLMTELSFDYWWHFPTYVVGGVLMILFIVIGCYNILSK
jgi:hypothetical protein